MYHRGQETTLPTTQQPSLQVKSVLQTEETLQDDSNGRFPRRCKRKTPCSTNDEPKKPTISDNLSVSDENSKVYRIQIRVSSIDDSSQPLETSSIKTSTGTPGSSSTTSDKYCPIFPSCRRWKATVTSVSRDKRRPISNSHYTPLVHRFINCSEPFEEFQSKNRLEQCRDLFPCLETLLLCNEQYVL